MLEPIEEKDLDLGNKFPEGKAGAERKSGFPAETSPEASLMKEEAATPSQAESGPKMETLERKEGQAEKDATYAKILAKANDPVAPPHDDIVITDAKDANDAMDYETKVVKLVELAQAKGVIHAVKVAKHMEDNYLLDELHDRLLAQDLHDALVKKGMITEI